MADAPIQAESAHPEASRLAWHFFKGWALSLLIAPYPAAYLSSLLLELDPRALASALGVVLPVIVVVLGVVVPYGVFGWIARAALARRPTDGPGSRLSRLLRIPRQLELVILSVWLIGAGTFATAMAEDLRQQAWAVAFSVFLGGGFASLTALVLLPSFERAVMPLALEELYASPAATPEGGGFFWPRQRWYLPYALGVIGVLSLAASVAVVVAKLGAATRYGFTVLAEGGPDAGARLRAFAPTFMQDLLLHLAFFGVLILGAGALAAWRIARREGVAAGVILGSLRGLTKGEVSLPRWVATDEMGDLAVGTAQLMSQLDEVPKILRNSATALAAAAEHLTATSNEQGSYLRNQAAALEQTRRTAETIRRGSMGAAEQTEVALKGAERADRVGVAGTESIAQSRAALDEIRTEVSEIAVTIRSMDDRSRQIGQVAETMQDLVEQTHVLAVNAAIEAARSGEQGVGFAVVAREMRTLVDKSAQAAAEVRQLLEKVREASGDAVERTLQGEKRVESGLAQIEASADKLRELLLINQSSSSALRQIAGIVRQQTTGVSEIFDALSSQQTLMDQTLARVESTVNAVESLEMVSHEVELAMKGFGGAVERS